MLLKEVTLAGLGSLAALGVIGGAACFWYAGGIHTDLDKLTKQQTAEGRLTGELQAARAG